MNEKKLGSVVLFEKQGETLLEKVLSECWYWIQGYVKGQYASGAIEFGSPESLRLEKREHLCKGYIIQAFQEGMELGLKLPDLVGKIKSKYHMDMRKKKAMNMIQEANVNEYKQLKERADEDGNKLELWDILVSNYPTPDQVVNSIYEKEFLKNHGVDIDTYESYLNGEIELTKQATYEIRSKAKKYYKELGY